MVSLLFTQIFTLSFALHFFFAISYFSKTSLRFFYLTAFVVFFIMGFVSHDTCSQKWLAEAAAENIFLTVICDCYGIECVALVT